MALEYMVKGHNRCKYHAEVMSNNVVYTSCQCTTVDKFNYISQEGIETIDHILIDVAQSFYRINNIIFIQCILKS